MKGVSRRQTAAEDKGTDAGKIVMEANAAVNASMHRRSVSERWALWRGGWRLRRPRVHDGSAQRRRQRFHKAAGRGAAGDVVADGLESAAASP
jgi:hypothetical protein